MSRRQKHLQRLAHGFRVTEKQQSLGHCMDAAVAGQAERDEVVHRVILGIARDTFSHPVDVMDAKLGGRFTFPAGIAVPLHNGALVATKIVLVAKSLLGPLSVLGTERTSLGCFGGSFAVHLQLTGLATRLWASLKRVRHLAISAWANSPKLDRSGLPSAFRKFPNVQLSARDRAARKAKALNRTGRLKARVAPRANALHVAAARHAPRLHLARSAALKISARRLNRDAAIGALNWLVFRDCSHEQNVVGAFPNG